MYGFMETRFYHRKELPDKFWLLSLTYTFSNVYETVSGIHGRSIYRLT
jgi:hypothetical protein